MAVKGPSCDLITPVLTVESIRLTGKYSLGYRVCAALYCSLRAGADRSRAGDTMRV